MATLTAEQKLIRWLQESCDYWMERAKVPGLTEQDNEEEVALAFNNDPEVIEAWKAAMA
jgi:hypothetical protein